MFLENLVVGLYVAGWVIFAESLVSLVKGWGPGGLKGEVKGVREIVARWVLVAGFWGAALLLG